MCIFLCQTLTTAFLESAEKREWLLKIFYDHSTKKCCWPIGGWRPNLLITSWMHIQMSHRGCHKLGRLCVPNALYHDWALQLSWFLRRRFLSVFTISGHGGHLVRKKRKSEENMFLNIEFSDKATIKILSKQVAKGKSDWWSITIGHQVNTDMYIVVVIRSLSP